MGNSVNVGRAVRYMADLMGLDRATLAALADSGAVFDWQGMLCRITVRPSCWVDLFDAETGDMLLDVAIPASEARVIVGEPIGEKVGWRRFKTAPAPLGFYHKHNKIFHRLNKEATIDPA